ncbi:MAG: DUF1592 domain-containing protein [Planctomycetota bacterium]|nr:DUF1592 domain-containing protein [Planctomycetota bacterium]
MLRQLFWPLLLVLLLPAMTIAQVPEPISHWLQSHCTDCHSGKKPKGGIDLEVLIEDGASALLEDWRRIERVITSGEMPPEGEPAPTSQQRDVMISSLRDWLQEILQSRPELPGTVGPRRLGRSELRATILDLTGVEIDIQRHLPADPSSDGFDNQGGALSNTFIERLFRIAEEVAVSAVILDDGNETPTSHYAIDAITVEGAGRVLSDSAFFYSRGTASVDHHFPRTGTYQIHIHGWGQQAGDQATRFRVQIGNQKPRVIHIPESRDQPGMRSIEFLVPAGPHKISATFINDYYKPDHPEPSQRDRNAAILSFTVKGPAEGLEPSVFQTAALAGDGTPTARLARGIQEWLPRFWRGPVTPQQCQRLVETATEAALDKTSAESLLRAAVVTAIASPRFILRLEIDPTDAEPGTIRDLSGHELATRLAYFLWGTTPDPILLAAAGRGELDDSAGLLTHTRRLLVDPRSRSLASNFATQWLRIRDLGDLQPDPQIFAKFDKKLLDSMRLETIEFFDHILRQRLPINELVAAPYTFVDQRLARHYGLEPITGDEMRLLEVEPPRGGLLSQASVLLATSTRQRTSPVLRGKWLLEVLLDAAPPPPPPGAGSLPLPGEKGADLPLREQLRLHRNEPACSICHRRMDALGFSLERFDAIGRYRTGEIDDRGELPDGSVLEGIEDLRANIQNSSGFQRSLARNLLTYALGRGLVDDDAPAVARLLVRLESEATIAALIEEIVLLEAFRRRLVR